VVVVDVSQSYAERERQLIYWLDFILSCLPNNSKSWTASSDSSPMVSILIVGTQCDKLLCSNSSIVNKTAYHECMSQLESLATRWTPQCIVSSRIEMKSILVSSITKANIAQLIDMIVSTSHAILDSSGSSLVPLEYIAAENALDSQPATSAHTLRKQHALIQMSDLLGSEPLLAGFDRSMAEYLNNIGEVVISPSKTWICLDPHLLSMLMALFICSDEHHHLMHSGNRNSLSMQQRQFDDRSIMSETECLKIVRTMLERDGYRTIGINRRTTE
jgi:hypothetical protein